MATKDTQPTKTGQPRAKSWLQRGLASLVIYAVAFSAPFMLENASEIGDLLPAFARRLMDSGAWYQIMTSAGPRHVLPRYTALVALDPKTLPPSLLLNVCAEERELIARLIRKVDRAQPSMIVLDFVFLKESCDPPQTGRDSGTEHVTQALQEVAGRRPVIIGQEVTIENEELVTKPSIPLDQKAGIESALVTYNKDLRKVPLMWDVRSPGAGSSSDSMDTLAYKTARLYRAAFPDQGKALKDLSDSGRHPYTNFIPENKFAEADAFALLCDPQQHSGREWRSCTDAEGDATASGKLKGHIAVVGWRAGDLHHTIIGDMPGFVIHANYIEALLDEHYLKTIDFRWQLFLSALWFLCMDIPFWIREHETARPFATALLVWIASALLVYYVAVVNLGFYSGLLVPSLAALAIRSTYRWHETREKDGITWLSRWVSQLRKRYSWLHRQ